MNTYTHIYIGIYTYSKKHTLAFSNTAKDEKIDARDTILLETFTVTKM
jgi:hypothetical protein